MYSDVLRLEMKKWDVSVSIIEPQGYRTGMPHFSSCIYWFKKLVVSRKHISVDHHAFVIWCAVGYQTCHCAAHC